VARADEETTCSGKEKDIYNNTHDLQYPVCILEERRDTPCTKWGDETGRVELSSKNRKRIGSDQTRSYQVESGGISGAIRWNQDGIQWTAEMEMEHSVGMRMRCTKHAVHLSL